MALRRPRSPRPLVLLPGSSPQIHKHTPDQSSYLRFPPSPTSLRAIPRTPLKSPARLHLRALLPSSPLSPRSLASAPCSPYPWIWRCHQCGSRYRLSVTRRCLHDGHFFCSDPPFMEESAVSEDDDEDGNDRRRKRPKTKKRAVGCTAEFDYSGWDQYNSWRRYVKIYKYEKARTLRRLWKGLSSVDEDDDEEMEDYQIPKNCWDDCDYPSECKNMQLKEELERRHFASLFSESIRDGGSDTDTESEEDGEEEWEFKGRVMEIEDWEVELQKEKMAALERVQKEELEQMKFAVAIYGDVPSVSSSSVSSSSHASLLSNTSFLSDVIEIEDTEDHVVGSSQIMDVPLSSPSSAPSGPSSPPSPELQAEDLFMPEFASKRRRKSLQKIAQLTCLITGDVRPMDAGYEEEKLRSPLKEGFGFWEGDDVPVFDREAERGNVSRRRGGLTKSEDIFGDGEEEGEESDWIL